MTKTLVPRADRFVVELPVRYRAVGEHDWSYGLTLNISTSGLLFRAFRPVEIDTPVEFEVSVPRPFAGHGHACLMCTGHVVRGVLESDEKSAIAATIASYRLMPTDDPLVGTSENYES